MNVTLTWKGDGSDVKVAGEFNSWSPQDAQQYGDSWQFKIDLQPGRYQYKWVVDGNWLADESQPVDEDQSGNKNNIVSVEATLEDTPAEGKETEVVEEKPAEASLVETTEADQTEVSGDSDSWERVSDDDCLTTSKPVVSSSDGDSNKVLVERIFSPTEKFSLSVESQGTREEYTEYTVYYWDTPDYLLMKKGIWCKQFQNSWLIRKLAKNGVQTIEEMAEIEKHLEAILGHKGSMKDFTEKILSKRIEFPGASTRWKVEDFEVRLVKEGELQTVHVRTQDNVADGLKRILALADKLDLKNFRMH